jgi:hypothetical protein
LNVPPLNETTFETWPFSRSFPTRFQGWWLITLVLRDNRIKVNTVLKAGRRFKASPAHDLYYEEVGENNLDTTATHLLFYLCIGVRLRLAR